MLTIGSSCVVSDVFIGFVYRGGAEVAGVGASGERVAGAGAEQRRGARDVAGDGGAPLPRAARRHARAGARGGGASPRASPRLLPTRTFQAADDE